MWKPISFVEISCGNMIKYLFQVLTICLILHQIACDECDTLPKIKSGLTSAACCRIPMLFNNSWIDDCKGELDLEDRPGGKLLEIQCKLVECVFKKGGGIIDGKPSVAEIKKQMKPILNNNPGWENVFNEAVDKCVPEAIAKEDETRKRSSEPPFNIDKNVNTMYCHLVTCMAVKLFSECPLPADGENPDCAIFKDYAKKCVNEFPPRFMKQKNPPK